VGTQYLSYLFAYNLDGHHCQYISGSPQLKENTLRQQKGAGIAQIAQQEQISSALHFILRKARDVQKRFLEEAGTRLGAKDKGSGKFLQEIPMPNNQ